MSHLHPHAQSTHKSHDTKLLVMSLQNQSSGNTSTHKSSSPRKDSICVGRAVGRWGAAIPHGTNGHKVGTRYVERQLLTYGRNTLCLQTPRHSNLHRNNTSSTYPIIIAFVPTRAAFRPCFIADAHQVQQASNVQYTSQQSWPRIHHSYVAPLHHINHPTSSHHRFM